MVTAELQVTGIQQSIINMILTVITELSDFISKTGLDSLFCHDDMANVYDVTVNLQCHMTTHKCQKHGHHLTSLN